MTDRTAVREVEECSASLVDVAKGAAGIDCEDDVRGLFEDVCKLRTSLLLPLLSGDVDHRSLEVHGLALFSNNYRLGLYPNEVVLQRPNEDGLF